MKSFISEVADYLSANNPDLEKTTFIFPNKRAGRFFINHLGQISKKTLFVPEVYSIEEFVEEVSQLVPLDKTAAVFRLYETYREITPEKEREDFETFYGWSQTLVQDFGEIDRYLVQAKPVFGYLSDIQDIKHWARQEQKSELVKNYLEFWHRLPAYYEAFTKKLIADNKAHRGLQYRIAVEKISDYLGQNDNQVVFIGFNALNTAEEKIIQTVLDTGKGTVFWDTDAVFFADDHHGASYFLRKYHAEWDYYASGKNEFNWIAENYKKEKHIEIIGVPKNIGQAKYAGNILSKIPAANLKKTALVLGDEGLLLPILNSLPENVTEPNITMGLPLEYTPLASLFDLLLKTHSKNPNEFYYKEVIEIANHPAMVSVLGATAEKILQTIKKDNRIFLSKREILKLSPLKGQEILAICFDDYKNNPLLLLHKLEQLSGKLKQTGEALKNETLYHFNKLFNVLITLLETNSPVKSIKTLYQIYQNSIRQEVLDFNAAPFGGLQVMGMLETRALDFETLIITSVNEGILPSGKNTNSFIPYDLKKEKGLPTYKEKDAVYAYHFYRLLHRAKKVYLLYNSVPGDLNAGEKSRFITQLKIEKQPLHQFREYTVSPKVPSLKKELKSVDKSPEIIQKIKDLAAYGFSPSALLTYIRNPLDFYTNYILGVGEIDEVEEIVAANTLGTVIHDTLETLYKNDSGRAYLLTSEHIGRMLEQYVPEIIKQFGKHYRPAALSSGKNLIVFEVAKRYVFNFLKAEEKLLKENKIEIRSLEKQLRTELKITQLDFPVFLKGKADRIDRFNDMYRIIDYKTGKVEKPAVEIVVWEEIINEYKYSKAFQVLCYAYMSHKENPVAECLAGIISFKNLGAGFLSFATKNPNGKNKIQQITPETFMLFEEQLEALILEMCNPEIPFVEKEV